MIYDNLESERRHLLWLNQNYGIYRWIFLLKFCDGIKGHFSITNQFERSATSIGANIHEANYAQSKVDIIAKLQIALKECYETEYWIELFMRSELLDRDNAKKIYNDLHIRELSYNLLLDRQL